MTAPGGTTPTPVATPVEAADAVVADQRRRLLRRGKLIVVGSGIHRGQLTLEAYYAIKHADRLFYMCNPWVTELNPVAEDLDAFRAEGKHRAVAYEQMVDRILECLRKGENVCVAYYGHPGVAVWASQLVIR